MTRGLVASMPALLLASALLAACKGPASAGSIAIAPAAGPAGAPRVNTPGVLASIGKQALVTVQVSIHDPVPDPLAAAFRLLALPVSWNAGAVVELYSPTVSTGTTSVAIPAASFTGGPPTYGATATLPPLRPAGDYQASLYLQDAGGAIATTRLAGASTRTIALGAGPNTVTFDAVANALGNIVTYAGTGSTAYNGENLPATSANLGQPYGVVVYNNALYVAEKLNERVRKIDSSGTITTVAGNGTAGSAGDGGPATGAQLNAPEGLAFDPAGNMYIADNFGARVRMVTPGGTIGTFAGTGVAGYAGDNGPASAAQLDNPSCLCVANNTLYIGDFTNGRVRAVDLTSHTITTVAGGGAGGDGGLATAAALSGPNGEVVVGHTLYIAEYNANKVRAVDLTSGLISTYAGTGAAGFSGDGGPATAAQLDPDQGDLCLDPLGNLYIADYHNNRVRKVDTNVLASYDVQAASSTNHNVAAGNAITKDDTVTLDTGVADNLPGVGFVRIYLYGACYAGSSAANRALLAELHAPASWQTFGWDTSATPAAPATYLPASLVGGANTSTTTGQIDVEAYDTAVPPNLVGKASFAIAVFGRPQVTVQLQ